MASALSKKDYIFNSFEYMNNCNLIIPLFKCMLYPSWSKHAIVSHRTWRFRKSWNHGMTLNCLENKQDSIYMINSLAPLYHIFRTTCFMSLGNNPKTLFLRLREVNAGCRVVVCVTQHRGQTQSGELSSLPAYTHILLSGRTCILCYSWVKSL